MGTAEDISQEGEGVDGELTAGANHRHQDPLCMSAKPRAIAAPDFAVDHGRTNSLLGPVIRGLNRRIDQKPKPMDPLVQNVLGQPTIRCVQ